MSPIECDQLIDALAPVAELGEQLYNDAENTNPVE